MTSDLPSSASRELQRSRSIAQTLPPYERTNALADESRLGAGGLCESALEMEGGPMWGHSPPCRGRCGGRPRADSTSFNGTPLLGGKDRVSQTSPCQRAVITYDGTSRAAYVRRGLSSGRAEGGERASANRQPNNQLRAHTAQPSRTANGVLMLRRGHAIGRVASARRKDTMKRVDIFVVAGRHEKRLF